MKPNHVVHILASGAIQQLTELRKISLSLSPLALHGGTSKSSSLPAYGRTTLSRVRSLTTGARLQGRSVHVGSSEGLSYLGKGRPFK